MNLKSRGPFSAVARALQPPRFNAGRRFQRVFLHFLGVIVHIFFWDVWLARSPLLRPLVRRTMVSRWSRMARNFRVMALELGGMQIKLGQFLSSRADVIPDVVRRELAGLQDEVPPAPVEHVLSVIVEELGAAPDVMFAAFDTNCVAAASLGQVHFAELPDGRQVAVKVQRPHIEQIIAVDLSAISWVVRLIKNYPPVRRRADLEALLDEFSRVLVQELDYVQEARSAQLFRSNFAAEPGIHIPEPVEELSRRRVLVMERIAGIKVNDLATLTALGVRPEALAERLNQAYLKQFFVDGFFHADPHPGNLFVRVDPDGPAELGAGGTPFTLIFIDFGMVGRLPDRIMEAVRNGVVGLATNDVDRIMGVLDMLEVILPGADRPMIRAGIETLLGYVYNRTMQELTNLDIEAIMVETKGVIYDLPFQIPQDLLYLGRALSMVSGLATEIAPNINLFAALQPFAQQMLAAEQAGENWLQQAGSEALEWGQLLVGLPRQLDGYLRTAARDGLQVRQDLSRLERSVQRIERAVDRLTGGLLAGGLWLAGRELHSLGRGRAAQRLSWAALAVIVWTLRPRRDS
jgi:predicted unusual protein kinase regulating ubiquinone biosynthesis (AarF/ABC1/UbiB family)